MITNEYNLDVIVLALISFVILGIVVGIPCYLVYEIKAMRERRKDEKKEQ